MPELYCRKNMLYKYRQECQIDYEKSIPLNVLKVNKGIV